MGEVTNRLWNKLETAFTPAVLEIVDESEKHRGHAGHREGGESHFRVLIVSGAFEGQSRVARQQSVYKLLAEELKGPIHALSLKTLTPAEAD